MCEHSLIRNEFKLDCIPQFVICIRQFFPRISIAPILPNVANIPFSNGLKKVQFTTIVLVLTNRSVSVGKGHITFSAFSSVHDCSIIRNCVTVPLFSP